MSGWLRRSWQWPCACGASAWGKKAVYNHEHEVSVLFRDGSWRTFDDATGAVRDACVARAGADDPEAAVEEIFETFFDPLYGRPY